MRFRLFLLVSMVFALADRIYAFDNLFSVPSGETNFFEFLNYSLSPRSEALGGAGVALVDGIADADLNPAAAARDSGDLSLGQGYFPTAAATANYISWNIPVEDQRITVEARYLGDDNTQGFNSIDDSTAAYGGYTLKLQAGTAGYFEGFAYGVSAAFAQHTIADGTYEAGLFNLGLWRDLQYGFSAGFSMTNVALWTSKAQDGSEVIAPTVTQGGLAYSRALPDNFRVSAALDARKVNDENIAFPAGLEASWRNILSVRLGYPFAASNASADYGLGLRWSRYGFDYVYQGNTVTGGAYFWALSIRY
jgi:hypothetical protein